MLNNWKMNATKLPTSYFSERESRIEPIRKSRNKTEKEYSLVDGIRKKVFFRGFIGFFLRPVKRWTFELNSINYHIFRQYEFQFWAEMYGRTQITILEKIGSSHSLHNVDQEIMSIQAWMHKMNYDIMNVPKIGLFSDIWKKKLRIFLGFGL